VELASCLEALAIIYREAVVTRRPTYGAIVALILVSLFALPAGAREPTGKTAEELFQAARQKIAEKDYAAACPMLEESLLLEPAPGTQFNLARCYELVGRLASAWKAYGAVAEQLARAHDAGREKVARERMEAILPHLSYLVLEPPPGVQARVTIDGAARSDEEARGTPIPLDHGDHDVSVVLPGRRPWETRVRVDAEGTTSRLSVPPPEDASNAAAPPPLSAAPPRPAPPAVTAPPPVPRDHVASASGGVSSARRVVTVSLLGSGVVAAGIGTYFGIRAFQLGGDARAGGASAQQSANDSHTDGDISTVAFVAAGALAAGGVLIWLTAPRAPVAVSVMPSPRAPGLLVSGTF